MQKKLNSLEDLSKIKFESLEPDREITQKKNRNLQLKSLKLILVIRAVEVKLLLLLKVSMAIKLI